MSKQAFTNRGKLITTSVLDGFSVVFVSGEVAMASIDVCDCDSHLNIFSNGSVEDSIQLGRLKVRDLISAFTDYSCAVEFN